MLFKNSTIALTSGWIPFHKIEFGDFYTFYSYNSIEQSRLKLGLRSRHLINDRLDFKTYIAYGLRDERFKYDAEAAFVINRNGSRRNSIGGMMKSDAIQPGRSSNTLPIDNVFTSLISTTPLVSRSLVNETEGYLERQWFTGFSSRIGCRQSTWKPFGHYNYFALDHESKPQVQPSYTLAGLELSMRFAYGQRTLSSKFGSGIEGLFFPRFPVISLNYMKGMNGFINGNFNMDRLRLRVEEKLRTRKLGYSLFRVEGGKTWGTLPFTFLETPIANQIVLNDETAFNLMNYLEFVSDQYASIMWEQHFEGLLFNRIPFLKKLKWREVIFAKCYTGSLSYQNKHSNYLLPAGVTELGKPYYEVGFGIENIFKISRVDFTWRLNYTEKPNVYYFIAKPSFQFKF